MFRIHRPAIVLSFCMQRGRQNTSNSISVVFPSTCTTCLFIKLSQVSAASCIVQRHIFTKHPRYKCSIGRLALLYSLFRIMQRPIALAATAGLLCLVFIAQTLALPLPVGNFTLASQIFPPTIIYVNEPFSATATAEEPTSSTYAPSGPTGIICRADPRFHGALQASMYAIAILLTILTTVLSGLTTGVMGVDDLRLQIWVHTGDQKQKYVRWLDHLLWQWLFFQPE